MSATCSGWFPIVPSRFLVSSNIKIEMLNIIYQIFISMFFHAFGLVLPTGYSNMLHVLKIPIISWKKAHVRSHDIADVNDCWKCRGSCWKYFLAKEMLVVFWQHLFQQDTRTQKPMCSGLTAIVNIVLVQYVILPDSPEHSSRYNYRLWILFVVEHVWIVWSSPIIGTLHREMFVGWNW